MNDITSIIQYSKLISISHSGMNKVDRHFQDLEYLITISIQYSEILSNVTILGWPKLSPRDIMDVRFGRSTLYHNTPFSSYFALLTNMIRHSICHQVDPNRVEWIVMMEDLDSSFSSKKFDTFNSG